MGKFSEIWNIARTTFGREKVGRGEILSLSD